MPQLSIAVESILAAGVTSEFYNDEEAQRVISSLKVTQSEFCPDMTLYQIWLQEKPYYEQHGMSAFDCGYAGKKLQ